MNLSQIAEIVKHEDLIGTGNMARSLGILWAEQGHEVFSVPATEKVGQ